MSMFTLAISCLITSNLPWFLDLTFQVPMQYYPLQHRTWLPSPVTSTTGCSFCFGSISSFFLKLFLHWSLVAYWAATDLGSSSFSVISFCLFVLFLGFSRPRILKWLAIPFSSGPHFVRTLHHDQSILAALHSMAHSFIELPKAVVMWLDWLLFCDWVFQSVCPLMEKDKRLMNSSRWDRLTEWDTGSCSDGRGHAQ